MKALYELQTILSEIDRIKQIRGELPLEVKDLEDNIEGLKTRIENYRRDVEDFRRKHLSKREKINESQAKIARYKEQLDNVRNNREFDLLSKEVEFQTLEIELSEKAPQRIRPCHRLAQRRYRRYRRETLRQPAYPPGEKAEA